VWLLMAYCLDHALDGLDDEFGLVLVNHVSAPGGDDVLACRGEAGERLLLLRSQAVELRAKLRREGG
jgi:hypothetical protein